MSVKRPNFNRYGGAFNYLNGRLYFVGEINGTDYLNSAEVRNNHGWQMIANMSTRRADFGLENLNNRLYAVRGCYDNGDSSQLKSVECYDPRLGIWTPVADMSVRRAGLTVRVMDGIMYAVGGLNESGILKSVEVYKPSSGEWTSIADMHMCRYKPGVFSIGGCLEVIGGTYENGEEQEAFGEKYNPNTNTWTVFNINFNFW